MYSAVSYSFLPVSKTVLSFWEPVGNPGSANSSYTICAKCLTAALTVLCTCLSCTAQHVSVAARIIFSFSSHFGALYPSTEMATLSICLSSFCCFCFALLIQMCLSPAPSLFCTVKHFSGAHKGSNVRYKKNRWALGVSLSLSLSTQPPVLLIRATKSRLLIRAQQQEQTQRAQTATVK